MQLEVLEILIPQNTTRSRNVDTAQITLIEPIIIAKSESVDIEPIIVRGMEADGREYVPPCEEVPVSETLEPVGVIEAISEDRADVIFPIVVNCSVVEHHTPPTRFPFTYCSFTFTDTIKLITTIQSDTSFILGHNDNFNTESVRIAKSTILGAYRKGGFNHETLQVNHSIRGSVLHWICPQDYEFSDNITYSLSIDEDSKYRRYHKVYDFEKIVVCGSLEEVSTIEDKVSVRCGAYELSDIIVVRKEILSYDKKTL